MTKTATEQKMQAIERALHDLNYYPTVDQLYAVLSTKFSYDEFLSLLKNLGDKNFIYIHNGKILLLHNPKLEVYMREHNPNGACY